MIIAVSIDMRLVIWVGQTIGQDLNWLQVPQLILFLR